VVVLEFDGSRIRSINEDGLWYLDDIGNEVYIDFAECHANYVEVITSPEAIARPIKGNPQKTWDDAAIAKYIKHQTPYGREVACWNSEGIYMIFHTKPPVRFNFSTAVELRNIRYAIDHVGWKTCDLT
jgi:hypothetical protein